MLARRRRLQVRLDVVDKVFYLFLLRELKHWLWIAEYTIVTRLRKAHFGWKHIWNTHVRAMHATPPLGLYSEHNNVLLCVLHSDRVSLTRLLLSEVTVEVSLIYTEWQRLSLCSLRVQSYTKSPWPRPMAYVFCCYGVPLHSNVGRLCFGLANDGAGQPTSNKPLTSSQFHTDFS